MSLKPFIPAHVHYKSEHFQYKFISSFLKLLHLKGVELAQSKSSQRKEFFETVHEEMKGSIFIKFLLNREPLGFINLPSKIANLFIQNALGGSRSSVSSEKDHFSKLDLSVIDNFSGVFSLSIREGLKPFTGKKIEVEVLQAKYDPLIKEFIDREAFFIEEFTFLSKNQTYEMSLGLRVESFKKKKL